MSPETRSLLAAGAEKHRVDAVSGPQCGAGPGSYGASGRTGSADTARLVGNRAPQSSAEINDDVKMIGLMQI